MSDVLNILLILLPYFLVSGVIALLVTKVCITLMPILKMVDVPRGRHMHKKATPVGGGIAISLAFLAVGSFFLLSKYPLGSFFSIPAVKAFFIPSAVIVITGLIDDRFELNSIIKLGVQVAVAVYFYFTGSAVDSLCGIILPSWISLPLTVCWTVGIINAFNLIDGLDGVAAGLSAISAFFLSILCLTFENNFDLALFSIIICGACLGFLRYNFHPAKIFMGDTGSMFLGTCFAYISMKMTGKTITLTGLIVPVLMIGIPLFDVFLAILRRFFRKYVKRESGVGIMSGDHDHLHHRINEELGNQRKTALLLYLLAALLSMAALGISFFSSYIKTLPIMILVAVMLIIIRHATLEGYDIAKLLHDGARNLRRNFLLTALHPIFDTAAMIAAYLLAGFIFDGKIQSCIFSLMFLFIIPYPVVLGLSGIYRTHWLRIGIGRYMLLVKALLLASIFSLAGAVIWSIFHQVGRSYILELHKFFLIFSILGISIIVFERFLLHYIESSGYRNLMLAAFRKELPKSIVYGGGIGCRILLNSQYCISRNELMRNIIGIADDNLYLKGLNVYGVKVLGTGGELEKIWKKSPFEEIIITAQISGESEKQVLEFADKYNVKLKYFKAEIVKFASKDIGNNSSNIKEVL